jgi:acyl-coenzyme A synthetase/AMP-(fatty) acid ligase
MQTFWGAISEHGISWFSAVPAIHAILLRHAPLFAAAGAPTLRFLASSCGAGVLARETASAIEAAFDTRLLEGWALVETSQLITMSALRGPRTLGTVGKPVPGIEVRLDACGEVLVRGEAVCDTALGSSRRLVDASGWLSTRMYSAWREGALEHPTGIDATLTTPTFRQT